MKHFVLLMVVALTAITDIFAQPVKTSRQDLHGDALPPQAIRRYGTVRFRHGSAVRNVVFTADGKSLFSLETNGSVRQWDVATGRELRHFKDACRKRTLYGAMGLAISPNGKTLAAGTSINAGGEKTLWVWDVPSGRLLYSNNANTSATYWLAFSPDGKTLLAGGEYLGLTAFEARTGKRLGSRGKSGTRLAFDLSPDGKYIVTQSEQHSLQIWNAKTGQSVTMFGHIRNELTGAAISPDGKRVAGISSLPMKVWDVASGKEFHSFPAAQVKHCRFSPDGKILAAAHWRSRKIYLWETRSWKPLRTLRASSGVHSLSFSPDSKWLATANANQVVQLWDPATGKERHIGLGHQSGVHAMALSPDGKILITADDSPSLRVWQRHTGKELQRISIRRTVTAVVFLPKGKQFVTAYSDKSFGLWDLVEGQELRGFTVQRKREEFSFFQTGMFCCALSPSGKHLATAGADAALRLWDVKSGKVVRSMRTTPGTYAIGFSPDGRHIATAAREMSGQFAVRSSLPPWTNRITIWDAATGKRVHRWRFSEGGGAGPSSWPISRHGFWRTHALAYAPNGRTLAFASPGGVVYLWETTTYGSRGRLFAGLREMVGVTFSPDSKILASGSINSGKVRLWNVLTRKTIRELSGHRGAVFPLLFSPDGRELFSGSSDTTVLVWRMKDRP